MNQKNDKMSTQQFLTKLIFPITIIILALIFKSSLESLIPRTSKAELLGSKWEFVSSEVSKEYVNQELGRILGEKNIPPEARESIEKIRDNSNTLFGISPISLYYLIGSSDCSALNYDMLLQEKNSNNLKEIHKLESAGLATLTVKESVEDHKDIFGKQQLTIRPTKIGVIFLRSIGIEITNCSS